MVLVEHTFDAKCRQTPVRLTERDGGMPPLKAQFFYSSSIPIDDPLSASSHTATTDFRKYKELLRPFGRGDNNALEKVWLSLSTSENRSRHEALRSGKSKNGSMAKQDAEAREDLVQRAAQKYGKIHDGVRRGQDSPVRSTIVTHETQEEICCSELLEEIEIQLKTTTCSLARAVDPAFSPEAVAKDVAALVLRRQLGRDDEGSSHAIPFQAGSSRNQSKIVSTGSHARPSTPKHIRAGNMTSAGNIQSNRLSWAGLEPENRIRSDSQLSDRSNKTTETPRNSVPDDGITGNPFARVNSPRLGADAVASSVQQSESQSPPNDTPGPRLQTRPRTPTRKENETSKSHDSNHPPTTKSKLMEPKTAHVTVGISRLHMVDLPALQMKPIYWSPINDIAVVMRATWFYRQVPIGLRLELSGANFLTSKQRYDVASVGSSGQPVRSWISRIEALDSDLDGRIGMRSGSRSRRRRESFTSTMAEALPTAQWSHPQRHRAGHFI